MTLSIQSNSHTQSLRSNEDNRTLNFTKQNCFCLDSMKPDEPELNLEEHYQFDTISGNKHMHLDRNLMFKNNPC